MVATKSPAPRRRAIAGRNGITIPNPSRSMNTVRNSVPSEALRAGRAGAVADAGRSVGGGAVMSDDQGVRGQGTARKVARRVRRHQAPVAAASERLVN